LYFAFLFNSSSFAIRLLFGFQVSGCIACSFLLILLVLCFLGFRSQVACLRVQCSFPSLVRCFLSSRPQFALLASFVLSFRLRCLFAFMFLCFSDPGLSLHFLFFCCYPCSLLSSLPGLRLHFCILNIIDISVSFYAFGEPGLRLHFQCSFLILCFFALGGARPQVASFICFSSAMILLCFFGSRPLVAFLVFLIFLFSAF
jgi:hypothetical protein